MNLETFLNQDLSVIKKELNLDILKKKDDEDESIILHELFWYRSSLPKVKYIFRFCKKHYPSLFFEKNDLNKKYLVVSLYFHPRYLCVIKYVLKFSILNFPYLFLEKDEYGHTCYDCFDPDTLSIEKYVLKFFSLNFPEISYSTNNFILPLTIEIQN